MKKIYTYLTIIVLLISLSTQAQVQKKPLIEVFTSSTCGPCAAQNPILSAFLENKEGQYSLIKYQMDWPGSGDPYYTAEGGVRKSYYGVTGVPAFFVNSDNYFPVGDITEDIFADYVAETTNIEIQLSGAIDGDDLLNVEANIVAHGEVSGDLVVHIAVLEKLTVNNVSSNGETAFEHVMLKMFPNASGTELTAMNDGDQTPLNFSHDMSTTFMEDANDLAVIAFIQNNDTKEVLQSEFVSVTHPYTDYNLSFVINDDQGNAVEEAEVFVQNYGTKFTDENGELTYTNVLAGDYNYDIIKSGLLPVSGTTSVSTDVCIDITMETPAYFFYQDFEAGIPEDWTLLVTSPDYLYAAGGKVIFFRQADDAQDNILVTPQIDLSIASELIVDIGDVYWTIDPSYLHIGTMTDPNDASTFTEIDVVEGGTPMEEYTFDLSDIPVTDSYIAFSYEGERMSWVSIDNIKVTEGSQTNISELIQDLISIYPNPAVDQLGLTVDYPSQIKVYSMNGQLVLTESVGSGFNKINVSELNNGIFILHIENKFGSATQKLIIQR